MKFKIRYADQIVGIFSLAAIAGLLFLIFSIGAKQNWFVKKNYYFTIFDSGEGISVGQNITYKGFTLGKVKSITLEGNMVRVDYYILEDYASYVKEGTLVEVAVSPIGLGASFSFYPGKGPDLMETGREIYRVGSIPGKKILETKQNQMEKQADSITSLIAQVSTLLDNLNHITREVDNAFVGRGQSNLTLLLANIKNITTQINLLLQGINDSEGPLPHLLGEDITGELESILKNLDEVTKNLNPIAKNANTLVENATPQIDNALLEINTLLLDVQDVLEGVKNNPLIKKGVPDRSQTSSATLHLRDTDF